MKTKLLLVIVFFTVHSISAQTCQGTTFSPPATPTSFDYTYTGTGPTGWQDAAGNNRTAPPAFGSVAVIETSVGILSDLNYDFATMKGGLFYVAPGINYSGDIDALKDIDVIIAGTATLTNEPDTGTTAIYIYDTGEFTWAGVLSIASNDVVHNNGTLNILGGLAVASNSSFFYAYEESLTTVTGNTSISGTYNNCGLLEMQGDLSTQGSSNFNNGCATYVNGDFHINGDYTNIGLMYFNGQVQMSGPTELYNNGILIFDELILGGDDIIGIADQSVLIVRNSATLTGGASITNHYFYNTSAPIGTGLDSVCGTCTGDVEVLVNASVPNTVEEILDNCGDNLRIGGPSSATIDFDGIDDFLDSATNLTGYPRATAMAWVKIDPAIANTGTVISQGNFEIKINTNKRIVVNLNNQSVELPLSSALNDNEWANIAVTFDASLPSNNIKVYKNGELITTKNYIGLISPSFDLFTIGKDSASNTDYFKGDIDEVRIFDVALSEDQLRKIVYQEINENYGSVSGIVIPKTVLDFLTNATISWSNLKAYYPMTDIKTFKTSDFSSYNNDATLHNIETILEQTAPMPFTTGSDGDLTDTSTYTHGNVWDIENLRKLEWAILKVNNNVFIDADLKTAGLVVNANKTIEVRGDHMIQDKWYLELNGTIDLKNDSQLVQNKNSDLVTSVEGKILRRQEGQSSLYRYNYWSAPVGVKQATGYTDNNTSSNNANNTAFSLDMLKKGNGSAMEFTNANHQINKLSTRWMYTYENGVTYYDWGTVTPSTPINSGVGYIHKGIGPQNQLLFEGKPNNGTIKLSVTDAGGNGSVPGVSKTEYLLGNPYASAIDIHEFLDDNASVLDGSIQLWQQWAGNSHVTTEYEGGYAQVNKTGAVRAYQFVGGLGANNGVQSGTKIPSQYLSVGQSFMAEIKNSGSLVFKNSQRVFIKEADADGSQTNGSVFFRSGDDFSNGPTMRKLRLEFNALDGQATKRELLLGFSNITTDGYDYGYEAKNTDNNHDDLNLLLDGENMSIQSYAAITNDKVVPLALKTSGNNSYSIQLSHIDNIAEDQEIYLRDNLTDTYFDLRQEVAYTFTSEAGVFNERFEIVFQQEQRLSTVEITANNNSVIYYNNNSDLLYVKGLNASVSNLSVTNMLGQSVYTEANISNHTLENGMPVSKLATGIYIVSIKTQENQTLDKKIVVE